MDRLYIHDEITHNYKAAEELLPLVFEIYRPASVLDVGCGIGTWLKVAKELGVAEIMGVDGEYVERNLLKIDKTEFMPHNLSFPLRLNGKFDLCICLEVAEHLPIHSSRVIIETLVNHADVILFSAAVPGQGGQNHINEQWPAYWQDVFSEFGYVFLDYFRPKIWLNNHIEYWYRQNIFLAVKDGHPLAPTVNEKVLPLIHPELWERTLVQKNQKIMKLKEALQKAENANVWERILKKIVR